MRSTRIHGFVALLATFASIAISLPTTASAQAFEVSLPAGSPNRLVVLPGDTVPFTFDVRNVETQAIGARVWARNNLTAPYYTFGPGTPAQCGMPVMTQLPLPPPGGLWMRWEFPVVLGVGETVRCTYPLTRAANWTADTTIGLCTGLTYTSATSCDGTVATLPVGVAPDIGVRTELLDSIVAGISSARFRIVVTNDSVATTGDQGLITRCMPWAAFESRYELDGDLPGGCSVSRISGCYSSFSPFPYSLWRINVPGAAPGMESSCLVRMRFPNPLAASLDDVLDTRIQTTTYSNVSIVSPFTGSAIDHNIANNTAPFGVVLPYIPEPVSIDAMPSLALLALLLGLLASWRLSAVVGDQRRR